MAAPADFAVPSGCRFMMVKMWGNGGNAFGIASGPPEWMGRGGGGAALTAVLEVQPGQSFRALAIPNYAQTPSYSNRVSTLHDITSAIPQPLLVAGAGGSGGINASGPPPHGGAGGGLIGQIGIGLSVAGEALGPGTGGTQEAGGAGGQGWAAGCSGRDGGPHPCASYGTPACSQGICHGGGGGEGGFSGGGGGGYNGVFPYGAGGGGGSCYVAQDPRLVYQRRYDGNREKPGNALDPLRKGAGDGAIATGADYNPGAVGRVVVLFNALDIDPEATTRWKPMRSNVPMDIYVESPIELDLDSAVLQITGPPPAQTPVVVDHRDFIPVEGPDDGSFRYKVQWDGPWTNADEARLPAGNYTAIVRGTSVEGSLEMKSEPYDRLSLVEVKEIKLERLEGGELEDNPNVGGGLKIFSEATQPADVNPSAEIYDKVKVTATIVPEMPDIASFPQPVGVHFRSLDVDDPSDADGPIDDDNLSDMDNRGTPPNGLLSVIGGAETNGTVGVPVVGTTASAVLRVSLRQGDNYRVAASTHPNWLSELTVTQPSQIGSVNHPVEGPILEGAGVSRMLTVWRTVHVELDSMISGSHTQEQFQINRLWTSISGTRTLVDTTAPFNSFPNTNGQDDHDADGDWFCSALNPKIAGTVEFPVIDNNASSVEIKKGKSLAPPATDLNDRRYYLRDDLLDSLTSAQHHSGLAFTTLRNVYIELAAAPAPGSGRPFVHNLTTQQANQTVPGHHNNYKYWNTAVVLAFEGELPRDHDPGVFVTMLGPVVGITGDGATQPVAFTFLETARDLWNTSAGPCKPTVSLLEGQEGNWAHELMHALTLDHTGDTSGGLMCAMIKNDVNQPNRRKITELQQRKLRDMTSPNTTSHEQESCPNISCAGGATCGIN